MMKLMETMSNTMNNTMSNIENNTENNTIIHYPTFDILENGELDDVIYESRLEYLYKMLKDMYGTIGSDSEQHRHIFFHDVSVTIDEFRKCIDFCEHCRENGVIILSSIISEPRLTLKSQIHQTYENALHPPWYNLDLAKKLTTYVTEGFAVFDTDTLLACCEYMKERFPQIRLKNGCGCAGSDQIVLDFFDTPVPLRVLKKIEDCGVVIEKNLTNAKTSYSFTSFEIFSERFISIGIILENDSGALPGEKTYVGTTCVIMKEDDADDTMRENNASVHNYLIDISDPVFGRLHLSSTIIQKLIAFGIPVCNVYRSVLHEDVLPRVNLDIMFDGDKPVLLDSSSRVGGNTWSEFRGAFRMMTSQELFVTQSFRMVSKREQVESYREMERKFGDYHVILHKENHMYMVGIDHDV